MSFQTTRLRAGCKINLYLRVGKRLPNGYHELDTLFLPLSEPCDFLDISWNDNGKGKNVDERGDLTVEFSVGGIDPARNTLTRAHAWYASLTGFSPALRVTVQKNIPHGAGLGGGSADAAVLLRYLQEEAAKAGYPALNQAELLEQSAAIGADVPFFLLGTAANATGIGEKLVPVDNPYVGCFLVLVCPDIAVSTAWAFAALDDLRKAHNCSGAGDPAQAHAGKQKSEKISTLGLTSAGHRDTYSLAHGALPGNDFEDLVFTRYPQLKRLYRWLCGTDADVVRMSGTGSSLFALFSNEKKALVVMKSLASDGYRVYMQAL